MKTPILRVTSLMVLLACGDPELPAKTGADTGADGGDAGQVYVIDGEGDIDQDSGPADSQLGPDWDNVEVLDSSAEADAPADGAEPPPDAAPEPDAEADAAPDTPAPDPCPGCFVSAPPPGPHPAAKGTFDIAAPYEIAYGSGFGNGYKDILVLKPTKAGVWPVLFFVPGKQLAAGGGLAAKLGHPYFALLEHVARRGYVVAFVNVEQNALDGDHDRMADDLLAAVQALFGQVTTADPNKVAFAGHSLGAKVAFLATYKTLNLDAKNEHPDPAAVLLFGLVNDKPPLGKFYDAVEAAKLVVPQAATRFTFVQAHDDTTAPYLDPGKPHALAVYQALQTSQKQLLVLHGTGKDDPNPPTDPELHDDHASPLTVEGDVGSLADFALPPSHLDALDWYGYWKILVGALDFHFQAGDPKWAYGELRTHGGTLPGGAVVTHEVHAQGWQ